jgi:hypothetical protein
MQSRPYNRLLDEPPLTVRQETNTASPRTPIPIYFIHSLDAPLCTNPYCQCQKGRLAVHGLYQGIAANDFLLTQLAATESKEEAVRNATGQPATVVTVPLIDGMAEECQLYGHSWEQGAFPGTKQCRLCGIEGYCPYCVSMPPPGAQAFTCTRHARKQVQ